MDRTAIRAYYKHRTGDAAQENTSFASLYDPTPGSLYMEKSVARLGVFMDKRPIDIKPEPALAFLRDNPDILISRQYNALVSYYTSLNGENL